MRSTSSSYHNVVQNQMRLGGEDTGLVGSVVRMYEVPSFRGAKKFAEASGTPLTYDQGLAQASDRKVIEENREVVERLLQGGGFNAYMVPDLKLARELKQIDTKLKNGGRITNAEVRQVAMPADSWPRCCNA